MRRFGATGRATNPPMQQKPCLQTAIGRLANCSKMMYKKLLIHSQAYETLVGWFHGSSRKRWCATSFPQGGKPAQQCSAGTRPLACQAFVASRQSVMRARRPNPDIVLDIDNGALCVAIMVSLSTLTSAFLARGRSLASANDGRVDPGGAASMSRQAMRFPTGGNRGCFRRPRWRGEISLAASTACSSAISCPILFSSLHFKGAWMCALLL
mmetsp:Transcript_21672/g.50674  ORF Transcript_21672/g.50674 Transcript_21672/m.50674 type:complete len:211 (+) Transcript_21672:120-752(+)